MYRRFDEGHPGRRGRHRRRADRLADGSSSKAPSQSFSSPSLAPVRPGVSELDQMRTFLGELPDHIEPGFREGACLSGSALRIPRAPVIIVGMGGSATAGELASVVLGGEGGLPIRVVRGPSLPPEHGPGSVVILSSHSGETWEVLRAYEEAGRRGACRIVFTAGGQLHERADREGVPIFRLAPDRPPRTTVGSALGGLLGLFDSWLAVSNADRIAGTVRRIHRMRSRYASPRGPAAALAEALGRRTPIIYAEAGLLPIARRWKTGVEENAKRLAMLDELPGAFHNAIAGWDALPSSDANRWGVILLTCAQTLRPVAQGCVHFERLVRRRAAFARVVRLPGNDSLEYTLGGVVLGDFFSLFLADRLRSAPLETGAIDRFKASLGYADQVPPARTRAHPLDPIPASTA